MSKARVISAKQLNKIEPSLHTARNQKEINTIVNTAVQQILLNKNTTKNILDDAFNKISIFEVRIFRDVFNNNRDNLKQLLHVVVVGGCSGCSEFPGYRVKS